jgi:hypothetical protein
MNKVEVNDVSKEWEENIIDWNTFFRRNPQLFIKLYFGINLHLFQKIIIYLMARFPLVVLICARAVSKSFMTALFACSQCVLYPGIKVVVCAGTKGQAGFWKGEHYMFTTEKSISMETLIEKFGEPIYIGCVVI